MEHWVRARFTPGTPLGKDGRRVTACRDHIELSKNAAKEGMVLLKNKEATLPLARGSRVALFGKGTIDYVKGGGGSSEVFCPYTRNLDEGMKVLEEDGIVSVFRETSDFYADYVAKEYAAGGYPGMIAEPELPEGMLERARAFTDTAIISISRFSGEGWDRRADVDSGSKNYCDFASASGRAAEIFKRADFYLTDQEEKLIREVSSAFSKVIVVLNVGGMFDTSWAKNDSHIDALLMAWQGGMEGGLAEAELIMGIGNPSGKLADTFAQRLEDYPSTAGFHKSSDYVEYTEDIYTGYRYFETIPGAGEKVVYPFGYGLSYTTFRLDEICAAASPCDDSESGDASENGDEVTVSLRVTNTGGRAGKEVVQLYFGAPQGLLGKPARQLIRYRKTRLLQPGESQWITMRFRVAEMASYDDLGKISTSSWVLEKGSYVFYLGTDVRSAEELDYHLELKSDLVVRRMTSRLAPAKLAERMRSDGTMERLPEKNVDESVAAVFPPESIEKENDPDAYGLEPLTIRQIDGRYPETRGSRSISLGGWNDEVKKVSFSDVADGKMSLDDFVRELTDEDLIWLLGGQPNTGCANTFGWGNLPEKGIPNVMTEDGPAGLRFAPETGVRTTSFPCATLLACTWDEETVYRVGIAGGEEAKENNICVWLTPAVNIHRSPLCGRNFEYYSEDPYLAGKQAAQMVKGIQSNHVAATVKHFALNNKETNRKNSDSRVSERAVREIYLRQFEIIVREAHPWAVMTSYNMINGVRASENKELLDGILREEWGFDGLVTTDWWGYGEQYRECRAGNDVKMGCGYPHRMQYALDHGLITRDDLEKAARNVLTLILRVDD